MTIETTTESSSEDVSGLKKNNADLKRERDTWKQRAEAAEKKVEDTEDAGDELKTIKRERDNLKTERDDLVAERDTLAADLRNTRVDSAISAAIASGNVRPEMVEAVEAILHRKVQYEDSEATINGKSIADYAKSYFGKDGAHFVRAADNAGADSQGNSGAKAVAHSMTKENFDINEFTMIQLDNPELANSIAEAVGRPDLKSDA